MRSLSASVLAVALVALPATAWPGPPRPGPRSPAPAGSPIPEPVLLNGKPFPEVSAFVAKLPEPRRTFFVAPAKENGDGTEAHPWNDLQAALRALSPGDRLRVRAGAYTGAFRIDEACRDGDKEEPVQVFFDGKAKVAPQGDVATLTVGKAYWHVDGLFLELGEAPGPGVFLDATANHIALDHVRISGGSGPAVRIGEGAAHVTIANSRIAKQRLARAGAESFGVEIAGGAQDVLLTNNQLHHNPAGSIHVRSASAGGKKARGLAFVANTIHEDGSRGIDVEEAEDVRIASNTIYETPGRGETRGISLEAVHGATVQWNRVTDSAVALQVGRADPKDGSFSGAENVTIDRNLFESTRATGAAVDVEAGRRVRVTNNVIARYADALLVFGKPPQTQDVTVANNLVLGVSDVAFVLEDAKTVSLFDYNIFSPRSRSVDVQVGKRTLELARFLKKGTMPHTWLVPGVTILNGDLARVSGVETVDRGKALEGIVFQGAAPDIGVAER